MMLSSVCPPASDGTALVLVGPKSGTGVCARNSLANFDNST